MKHHHRLNAIVSTASLIGLGATPLAAQNPGAATTSGGDPVRVEFAQPQRRSVTRTLRMPASLVPYEAADLRAKTSGYVEDVRVDIGDAVKKGDILLTIDVPEMLDELHQAEAELMARRAGITALQAKRRQAESSIAIAQAEVARFEAERRLEQITYDRHLQLHEANAIPQQELDEVDSNLAIATAKLRTAEARVAMAESDAAAVDAQISVAEAQLGVATARIDRLRTLMTYSQIRDPFDGVITARMLHPGEFVRSAADGATKPLLHIMRVDKLRMVLSVPESDAPLVHAGSAISMQIPSLHDEPLALTITRTAMSMAPKTRTMRAEVDLDNTQGTLTPGMYARVVLTLETKAQALMIPSQAIRVRGDELTVLVADGNVARALPISIDYDDGIWVEVTDGLTEQTRVIVSTGGVVVAGTPIIAKAAATGS